MEWLKEYDTKILPILKRTERYRRLSFTPAEQKAIDDKDPDMTEFW